MMLASLSPDGCALWRADCSRAARSHGAPSEPEGL